MYPFPVTAGTVWVGVFIGSMQQKYQVLPPFSNVQYVMGTTPPPAPKLYLAISLFVL